MSDNKMTAYFYRIKCVTNLHVGSGEENYSVVDNEVERDPVTEVPTIFSSGIKGALREHFERSWGETDKRVEKIFGSSPKVSRVSNDSKEKAPQTVPGSFKFLNALLAARPVRVSRGSASYVMAASADQLNDILALAQAIGVDAVGGISTAERIEHNAENEKFYYSGNGIKQVEGYNVENLPDDAAAKASCLIDGSAPIALASAETLKKIALPIVAHNYLESGISKNLWYEEFVPYNSVFCMAIIVPSDMADRFVEFNNELCSGCIQIGANASLGYGLCRFELISENGTEVSVGE